MNPLDNNLLSTTISTPVADSLSSTPISDAHKSKQRNSRRISSRYGSEFPAGIISRPLKISRTSVIPVNRRNQSLPRRREFQDGKFWQPGSTHHAIALHKLHPPPQIIIPTASSSLPRSLDRSMGASSAGLVGNQGWDTDEDDHTIVREEEVSMSKSKLQKNKKKEKPIPTIPPLSLPEDFLLSNLEQEIIAISSAISQNETRKIILAPADERELLNIREAMEILNDPLPVPVPEKEKKSRFRKIFQCKKPTSPATISPVQASLPTSPSTFLPLVFPSSILKSSSEAIIHEPTEVTLSDLLEKLPYKRPHIEKRSIVGISEKSSRILNWREGIITGEEAEKAIRTRSSKIIHHSISREYRSTIEGREDRGKEEESVEKLEEKIVFSIARRQQIPRNYPQEIEAIPAVPQIPVHFFDSGTPKKTKVTAIPSPPPAMSSPDLPLSIISPSALNFIEMMEDYYPIEQENRLPNRRKPSTSSFETTSDLHSFNFEFSNPHTRRMDSIDSSLQEIEIMARQIGGDNYLKRSLEEYPGPILPNPIQRRSSNFTLSSIDGLFVEPESMVDVKMSGRRGVASMIRRKKMEEDGNEISF